MSPPADAALVERCARALRDAFLSYNEEFRAITRRARIRFEHRDWRGAQLDAAERIGLYDDHVGASTNWIKRTLGDRAHDLDLWAWIKRVFAEVVSDYPDIEFAKTYFSSVTRRVFGTVGVQNDIEFVGADTIPLRNITGPLIGNNYVNRGSLRKMFRRLLDEYAWTVPYADVDRCAGRVAEAVRAHYAEYHHYDTVLCIDVITPVFYRETRAYVIGVATGWTRSTPLVIAFKNSDAGIEVDAVLQTKEEVSVLFGFARSYFHVDLDPVGAGIVFLRKVMPALSVNELFTVLGRAKQGKTERYRVLARHLQLSRDRFIVAPGKKGMVMAVFTLPSHEVVFKVIRDKFAAPKETTPEDVKRCYQLVVRNNFAGRLVDAQEFRSLRLDSDRFDPELLDELLGETANTTTMDNGSVVIQHVYIERRLRPLDLYLREVSREEAIRATIDYGNALRELAATNIFPGDLLTKNFGVSRAGRVIFYDYDEICLLTDVKFRDIPKPRSHEDEMSAEPWYYVGPDDVFPEEFSNFLGLDDELRSVLLDHHGDLFEAKFWQDIQARLEHGEFIEVLPYHAK